MKKNDIFLFIIFIVFTCSFVVGINILKFLPLVSFSNPWQVIGPLTRIHYNPINDIIRFLFLLVFPLIFVVPLIIFYSKKYLIFIPINELSTELTILSNKKLLLLCLCLVIIVALNIPTYHASNIKVDTFHEGESLGTAVSYAKGLIPYKDFIFVHGIFQDPLRSVLAFKILGRSIGSERTIESGIKVIAFVFLFFVLIELFENYFVSIIIFYILTLFQIISHFYPQFPKLLLIPPRDVVTFLYIFLSLCFYKILKRNNFNLLNRLVILNFYIAFIAFFAFWYSIDRGFYISASYIFIVIIYLIILDRKQEKVKYIISSILGLILAIILLGFFISFQFRPFIKYVFVTMPQYKELMDGHIYPYHSIKYLVPIFLISFNIIWLTSHFIFFILKSKTVKNYLKSYIAYIFLCILGVFYFRSALGRSDWEHVIYSISITYLLFFKYSYDFWIYLYNHYYNKKIQSVKLQNILSEAILISVIFCLMLGIVRIHKDKVIEKNFPFQLPDTVFIPNDYKNTIKFLINNTGKDEYVFTLTSEAIWYYFINKPCPCRFPVVWFAAPIFFQQEIVNELKNKRVKFVIYNNKHWPNNIDGISIHSRLFFLERFIKRNFSPYITIDGNEIWKRKSPN